MEIGLPLHFFVYHDYIQKVFFSLPLDDSVLELTLSGLAVVDASSKCFPMPGTTCPVELQKASINSHFSLILIIVYLFNHCIVL